MLKFNISSLNTSTSELIIRYSTILELNNRENIVKFINGKPDSRYPYTGWGTRVYTDVFPLKGDNVEIIPIDAVGYRMDSTCNASTWNNNAYSFTNILNLLNNIEDNSRVFCASVYCYVSKDFNGNWARISAEGNLQGNTSIDYDLTKKGVWQKLKIIFTSSNGIPPVYLYWSKYGVIDFKTLKGYVLFAYPEYKSVKIDSKDPASWGTRMYTKVDSIKFGNAEIIPKNSIGYKMDSTCNASTWGNSSYSYTNISCLFQGDTTKTNSEYYCASVYCYLSEDFNGTWARISAEGNSQGNKLKEYDLLRKGTWQKLQIEFTSTKSIPPVYLYWSKNGVTDFKTLKGYVIFAYPEYKKISKPQAHIELNNTNITYHRSITQASIISSTAISDLLEKLKQLFKSNEVLSDTTSIKNDNFKVKIENELIGERTERWRYGWYLFKNKYTWQQKIFGNGFDYFQKFGDKFDKGNYDWPHNPIISSFLYSGLIGGIAFIWFLMLVVVNYVIYIKHHFFFFISFLVTFFFVFFSDYSLFNTPMFTFLCIIPFFTKYLSLKDEYGDIKNIPMKRILLW